MTGRQDPSRESGARLPWLGLRLGGATAVSSAGGNNPSAGGGGAYALFDARDFLADVSVDAFVGDGVRFIALGLGAYYPFFPGNVSPYLGGGLKVGLDALRRRRRVRDAALRGAAGWWSGREGYVQLRAELSWFVATSREKRANRPGDPGTRRTGRWRRSGWRSDASRPAGAVEFGAMNRAPPLPPSLRSSSTLAACGGTSAKGPPTWDACRASAEAKARVEADMAQGASFAVRGTPTFVVNGMSSFGLPPRPKRWTPWW